MSQGNALEPAARLAAEVHRLSNTVQILAALLAYRRQRLTDPVAREQIEWAEQILETLMLQTTPAAGRSDGDFLDYLSRQLATWRAVCAAASIELDWNTEKLPVPAATQISLALMVNELVTNAFKHAFPDRRGGRIHVELRRVDESDAELVVADDGVGFDKSAERTGSGFSLLDRMARQIGGSLSLESDTGMKARVRFPCPSPPPLRRKSGARAARKRS